MPPTMPPRSRGEVWLHARVARFVAFLRAVNVGARRVAMTVARGVLQKLGCANVSSFVNSGNLLFDATGTPTGLETTIRAALEDAFTLELTTFVRTERQVRALATAEPFGTIAPGHTHFVVLPLTPLTIDEHRAVEALSNNQDEVVVIGRDMHWLIRDRSARTSLDSTTWKRALPDNPTTARNVTMVERLVRKL